MIAMKTTLVLRNLPPRCSKQVLAQALLPWFPDLVIVIPDFVASPSGRVPDYAFANFIHSDCARACLRALDGIRYLAGIVCWPPLSVTFSRMQGFDLCIAHCLQRRGMTTMLPWIAPGPSRDACRSNLFRKRTPARCSSAPPMFLAGPILPGPVLAPSAVPSVGPSAGLSAGPSAGPLAGPSLTLGCSDVDCSDGEDGVHDQATRTARKKSYQPMPNASSATWDRRSSKRADFVQHIMTTDDYLACSVSGHR